MTEKLEDALARVRAQVDAAAAQAGRSPSDIGLVGASKTVDAAHLRDAISAGMTSFGENRVQEAAAKWPALRAEHPNIDLHLIGPLQSNKVATAVTLFDVIQSLDRPKLAAALSRCRDSGQDLPALFVQVNIGEEPQKSGIPPAELERFLEQCHDEFRLNVTGLMCIPPTGQDPVPYFERMAALKDRLGLPHLSMGMSGDYADAIMSGATMIRVGSAIFGQRAYAHDFGS